MINLVPWRERYWRHCLLRALCIMGGCYMLIITPAIIYLRHMEQRQQALRSRLEGLGPHRPALSNTTIQQVMAVHRWVWDKQRYILGVMRLLAMVPQDIRLKSLDCRASACELQVIGTGPQRLTAAFAKGQLQDLRQGGCPQCYRATINISLF